jgi:hypothetical protein
MPAYARFKNLRDYLDQRLARDHTNQNAVSEAFGWRRNYLNSVYHGLFVPSRQRCDQLAKHFGDDPHILRILAGHESPPVDLSDRQVREIYDLARSLTPEHRREAIKLLKRLTDSR